MTGRIALLIVILLAAACCLTFVTRSEITPLREPLSRLPMFLGEWEGENTDELDKRVLDMLGVDDHISRLYFSPDQSLISLYIGYYQSQREGDAIHSPLNCLPGAGWNPVNHNTMEMPIAAGTCARINSMVIAKGTDKQVVLYWYQSHGRITASEYVNKIYTVLDALRLNRTDAALVRIICPVMGMDPSSEIAAERHAADFATILFPQLHRFLPD